MCCPDAYEWNNFLRVNDFPTPSGWFMPAVTLRKVGGFDVNLIHHQDNEWLGKLAEANLKRFHLVELTAPVELKHSLAVRPWLANVIR